MKPFVQKAAKHKKLYSRQSYGRFVHSRLGFMVQNLELIDDPEPNFQEWHFSYSRPP